MANAKNTIQNIPLTGLLNLNTLKTDVKQFQDYNEKNSTVFGGELGPMWDSTVNIPVPDNASTSWKKKYQFPFYNSKGECYVIDHNAVSNNEFGFYKVQNPYTLDRDCLINSTFMVPYVAKINIKQDVDYMAYNAYSEYIYAVYNSSVYVLDYSSDVRQILYSGKTLDLTGRHVTKLSGAMTGTYKMSLAHGNYNSTFNIVTLCDSGSGKFRIYNDKDLTNYKEITCTSYNSNAFIVLTTSKVYFISKGGKIGWNETPPEMYEATVSSNNVISDFSQVTTINSDSLYYKIFNNTSQIYSYKSAYTFAPYTSSGMQVYAKDLYINDPDHYGEQILADKIENMANQWYKSCAYEDPRTQLTGHDGYGFIPGFNRGIDDGSEIYTLDGNIISITLGGIPVAAPLSLASFDIAFSRNLTDNISISSFKANDGWYAISYIRFSKMVSLIDGGFIENASELWKRLLIDNRYLLMINTNGSTNNIYDIEEGNFLPNTSNIGYINTSVPTYKQPGSLNPNRTFISASYISGYNAAFTINKAKFVGLLPNPSIMSYLVNDGLQYYISTYINRSGITGDGNIQLYLDYGNTILSPKYVGSNSLYSGALYPVNSDGNAIIPIGLNSQLITGYTNNDMIKNGKSVYPAFYWNNNIKIYGFYALSSMENVEGAFALQGQKYAFDNKVIYNISIENGVIAASNAICYKENLRYIGSLPTRAIFYSDFNKSFYQFTGDGIISKMFEASDINEIKSISQNPATFSVWINTEKGIYIISDIDMYRLNLISDYIYFTKNEAIIVAGEYRTTFTGHELFGNTQHNIALYNLGDITIQNKTFIRKGIPIVLKTAYYGLGSEQKANYDCWYIRLHSPNKTGGYIKYKVNTITDKSFFADEEYKALSKNDFDDNGIAYIKAQPKYQSAVATQLEIETDIPIYQISLGINATDTVAQMSKFNF